MTENSPPLNPLLARVKLPGEVFAIPSGGLFYEHGELDESVKEGEVHIYPMAAYDEVLIKTPSLLLNGEAVDKIFRRCIPQIKKPMDLLAKDVDYLLMALRQVTYGKTMEITFTHDCENAKEHNYNVDISKLIRDSKKINPTSVGKNFKLTLDNGQIVNLRPARYKEIVKMMQIFGVDINEDEKPTNEQQLMRASKEAEGLVDSIISVIRSVEDGDQIVDDENMIREWLRILKADWFQEISETTSKTANWGPSFEAKQKCKDCNKQIDITIPINPVSFFI